MNTCEYTEIPQNRERIFIIAFLDHNNCNKFEFPQKLNNKKNYKDFLEKFDEDYEYTKEDKIYDTLKDEINDTNTVYQFRRHYVRSNKNNNVPTLTANMGTGGHNVPIILQIIDGKKRYRKLTPKECFNFQGFPKSYKLPYKLSKGELYKQAGNSVTVELIKLLAENIYKVLEDTNLNLDTIIDKLTNNNFISKFR